MWGWQAVGSAESGCRGVVQWWGEGLVGERAAAYEAIEVSSRRFEIDVYDPSARSWKFPVSKMKHYLTWWAIRCSRGIPCGRLECCEIDQQTTKRQCVRLQGLLKVSRGCWAERRTSAPTLRSCSMGQPTGKKPGRIVESVVRLCE